MISNKSKNFLGLTPSLIILAMGHFLITFGLSILISQWQTDRMLYWEIVRFEHLISILDNSHLDGAVSQLKLLKQYGSGFQVIGLYFTIPGIFMSSVGYYTTKYDIRKLNRLPKESLPAVRLSKDILILIFSSLFALALISMSVDLQIISNIDQTFNSLLLQTEEDSKISDKAVLLMNDILKQSTFQFGFNTLYAVYFSIIGLTYLITYIIREPKNNTRLVFHNHLIIIGLFSFLAWLIGFILLVIGITPPPTVLDITIPSPIP